MEWIELQDDYTGIFAIIMQPLLTASDGADTVLNALHVLTHLILKPLHEVETIIITLIFRWENCIPERLIILVLLV